MNNDVIKVQLSCGVDYYKGEKGDKPVKGVDYFTQEDIAEIVEQIETGGIDLDDYATKEYVDSAVEGVIVSETDPTVPQWAKQPNKPSYTANEVGALPADTQLFSGNYNDLRNKPAIPTVPANVSAFNNDAGYLTSHQSLSSYATKAYVDSAIEGIDIPEGGITVETDPTVPSWAKQANKPTYTAQEVGALPANTALFSGDYNDLSNKPTLTPAPIVIQATIAGQPTVDNDGNYRIPLTITSNNMAEAYAQYQTHPSTVGISVDLTAMGRPTKMYMDCESFYRNELGGGGYIYLTFGEFNDSSITNFGFDFQNINVRLSTHNENDSYGTVVGVATVHQLASKANSADLAIVATSGDYNDLTNKPTIPTAYTLPTATTSTLGGVKVDGSTITIDGNGVISSSASGGSNYTFTNGLTENNGTVSWDLNDRIKAGSGQKSVYINGAYGVSGHYSFAEGEYTRADGNCAHAEGQYAYAVGLYQHAEGRANILDSNSIFQNIAGNGTNNNNRATMFARDWNGNEYLSGNLFVGCNDFTTTSSGLTTANAGGSKVATMSDLTADNIIYYAIEGEDPETGDPIRGETADTLTDTLDSVNEDIGNLLSGEWIDTSMISAGTDETTGDTIYLNSVLSDMETAISNAGGGSSYTAGDGISIDENNEISLLTYRDNLAIWILIALLGKDESSYPWSVSYNTFIRSTTKEEFENGVRNRQAFLITTQPTFGNGNISAILYKYGIRQVAKINNDGTINYSAITSNSGWSSSNNWLYYFANNILIGVPTTYGVRTGQGFSDYLFYNNTTSGLTASTIKGAIDEVVSNMDTRIPSAPTTDGDYVLKVSVSSGTPTYSWVSAT